MQNLTPSHVFLSQAFEPHRDDVQQAIRQGREQKRQPPTQAMRCAHKEAPIDVDSDVLEMSSSSDEEMPGLHELLAEAASSPPPSDNGRKTKPKMESKAKVKGRTIVSDDDDDSPIDEVNSSPTHVYSCILTCFAAGHRSAQHDEGHPR